MQKNCLSKTFFILLITLGILAFIVVISTSTFFYSLPEKSLLTFTNKNLPVLHPTETQGNLANYPIEQKNADRFIFYSDEKNTTIEVLNQTTIPENDPIDLSDRLGGIKDAPVYRKDNPAMKSVGLREKFWVLNVDDNSYRQIYATLTYSTPHLYFWVEDGVEADRDALANLSETFEEKIYPTNRKIFGSEWSPGVDNDVHLTILYARGLGGAAGYFSSMDSLTKEVQPYSNETEMFYLSADFAVIDSPYTYGVLAHELQHMIHWNVNRNESVWINEGMSELAVELNGYENGVFPYLFSINPDIQLNFWPGTEQGDASPHYGASYMFFKYLMQKYGIESIKELVANPLVGFAGIDDIFASRITALEKRFTSEILFQDWSIANYHAEYSGSEIDDVDESASIIPPFLSTETITCEMGWQERTVKQFGTDYIAVDCSNQFTINIEGETQVPLLPVNPYSGDYYFWSNYGDSSAMTLTRDFDFRKQSGDITFSYWIWFDIEKDYDYLYLSASTDGEKWDILNPPGCTKENPTGSNFGCGYNGKSGGWVKESVDLSKYAGKEVTLQFEYITDLAVNGDGFLIDNISIEETGYFSDFEKDKGGWNGRGFVRVTNQLPQNYGFGLISNIMDAEDLKYISVGGLKIEKIPSQSVPDNPPIVIISGLTRVTRQPAVYRIKIEKID